VVWGGVGDCRYYLDNERFILAETGTQTKKLFVWDQWQDVMHVIGEYAPHETAPFSSRDLHPAWDRTGAYVAFDSTHSGQGWQVCPEASAPRAHLFGHVGSPCLQGNFNHWVCICRCTWQGHRTWALLWSRGYSSA